MHNDKVEKANNRWERVEREEEVFSSDEEDKETKGLNLEDMDEDEMRSNHRRSYYRTFVLASSILIYRCSCVILLFLTFVNFFVSIIELACFYYVDFN